MAHPAGERIALAAGDQRVAHRADRQRSPLRDQPAGSPSARPLARCRRAQRARAVARSRPRGAAAGQAAARQRRSRYPRALRDRQERHDRRGRTGACGRSDGRPQSCRPLLFREGDRVRAQQLSRCRPGERARALLPRRGNRGSGAARRRGRAHRVRCARIDLGAQRRARADHRRGRRRVPDQHAGPPLPRGSGRASAIISRPKPRRRTSRPMPGSRSRSPCRRRAARNRSFDLKNDDERRRIPLSEASAAGIRLDDPSFRRSRGGRGRPARRRDHRRGDLGAAAVAACSMCCSASAPTRRRAMPARG